MRSFLLSKIAIPLHLAFVFAYLACVQPGQDGLTACLPLAFFALGLVEITLLFPSARAGEDVEDARHRTLKAMLRDPVFHFGVAALFFVLLQTLNGPRELIYDRILKCWRYTPGTMRNLPACLDMGLSIHAAFWILVIAPAMLAVRQGLGRKGRQTVLLFILGVAAALGLYGLFTYVPAEAGSPIRNFATFSSPAESGAFFFMVSCASFGLLFKELAAEEQSKKLVRFLLVTLLVNITATLYSLSCLSIVALVIALLVLLVYAIVYFAANAAGELRFTTLAAIILVVAAAAFLHFVAYPKNRIHECTAKIIEGPWQTETQKAESDVLKAAAWRMFENDTLGGTGAWCYGHESGAPRFIRDDEWKHLPDAEPGTFICSNDLARFLAEFGALGFALFMAPFAFIIIAALIRIVLLLRKGTKDRAGRFDTSAADADRINAFDVIPLDVLALFIAVGGVSAISFFASVFRCQLNMLTWAVFLSLAVSQLAKPKSKHK